MSCVLTEEQQLIKQTARDFAREYVEPVAAIIDRAGAYPDEVVKKMAEHDFLGLFLPEQFGGAAAGYLSYVLTIEELARSSGSIASILINHASLAAYSINRWGSEEQKQNYLPALCAGEKLGAYALTEPGAAPGAGPDKLVAVRNGNKYVLNGRKAYVANGGVANIYVVFAVTSPEVGAGGMSAFIVEAATDGISCSSPSGKMGLRGCPATELIFREATISAANLLGVEGSGMSIISEVQAVAAVAQGAQVIGIAQAAMEDAAKYAGGRIQFGRPIADFPAIQTMLAEMATDIHMARLAIYDTANLIDQGEPFTAEAAMVKLFTGRIGQKALIDVIQIEGGYGYSEEMTVSRLYRDIKGVIIMESPADFPEKVITDSLFE